MNLTQVLRKLEKILTDAERQNMFGSIEITIRGGRTTVISKTETDRMDNGEIAHATKHR